LELITQETLETGVRYLCEKDSDLKEIINTYGNPPLWNREPGFATLIYIILEQQVSLASARAAYNRLQESISPVTPENFLTLDPVKLKQIGFSRQKSGYATNLAHLICNKKIDLGQLDNLSDSEVSDILIQIKGIGYWTINIYLLMALGRKDIWPKGDLALINALKAVKGLSTKIDEKKIKRITSKWQPWRSVAARILWHYYLSSGSK